MHGLHSVEVSILLASMGQLRVFFTSQYAPCRFSRRPETKSVYEQSIFMTQLYAKVKYMKFTHPERFSACRRVHEGVIRL